MNKTKLLLTVVKYYKQNKQIASKTDRWREVCAREFKCDNNSKTIKMRQKQQLFITFFLSHFKINS